MSKLLYHPHHIVKRDPRTGHNVVLPGSTIPRNVKIEPAFTGLCAVIRNVPAQKGVNGTNGPFEIVNLYIGDGRGGAQWVAQRDRNQADENDTGVAYYFLVGGDIYFVLQGVVMRVADPKFEVIPSDTAIAWLVREANHNRRDEWKGSKLVRLVV